jgi:rRNA maturation endonuclease Nob1
MDAHSFLKIAERFLFSNRCKFCETPIPIGDAFCPKCGRSQI